jgi:hypothetical protein
MMFVSTEQSRQKEVSGILKALYDGTPKPYPNGYMMLFIPHTTGHYPSPEFRQRILFNHDQYIGDEAAFSIGGFQDLHNIIT